MNRLPSIRRWGVAALTGVTLFGGLSIVGAGSASATTPSVVATLTTGSAATTISGDTGTPAAANAADFTLSINGPVAAGDVITLTLGCPATGTATFATPVTSSDTNWVPQTISNSSSCNSNVETLKANSANAAATSSLTLSGIEIQTTGVSSQALTITGSYSTLGQLATNFAVPTIANVAYYNVTANSPAVTLSGSGATAVSPIQISQPTNLQAPDFLWLPGVNGTTTPVTNATLSPGGTSSGVSFSEANSAVDNQVAGVATTASTAPTFKITTGGTAVATVSATGLPTGLTLTGTPVTGGVLANSNGTVTLSGTTSMVAGVSTITLTANSAAPAALATAKFTLTVAPAAGSSAAVTLTLSGATWSGSPTVSAYGIGASASVPTSWGTGTDQFTFDVTGQPVSGYPATYTISGLSVTPSSAGSGPKTATVAYTNATDTAATTMATVTVGTVLGNATTIYGADGTADGTVAAEFENAYPVTKGGNTSVVLATDAPSANGSDALAASYLEGTLHTGLLITPSTTLGADAKQAMQLEGVNTVYVVGGPLAISPAVIAQIKALPAYNVGGLTTTGSNVQVVGPIYGTDGTAAGTAAAIATHFGSTYGAATFPNAYTSNGIGVYNDTTGLGSTTAPAGVVPTAIVVASTDWQDAMSIAPEAFAMHFPVILTGASTSATLDPNAKAALVSLGVKQVIAIGGQLALQNTVEAQIAALNGGISVLRIAGIDATDTAAMIAQFAWGTASVSGLGWSAATGADSVIVSHADYWSDALGAAALGGGANTTFGYEPILLTENPTTIGQYTTKALGNVATGVVNLTVLGGPLAMPSSTVQTLLAGL